MATTRSTARLEARISRALHAMLKRAAGLRGRTMAEFVISAAQEVAMPEIEQAEIIRLPMASQECFTEALISPPASAPALERAFSRRDKLLLSE